MCGCGGVECGVCGVWSVWGVWECMVVWGGVCEGGVSVAMSD